MRTLALLLALSAAAQNPAAPPASATEAMYQGAAASAERKIAQLQRNAQASKAPAQPVTFTESELNAYVESGALELPEGVERVRFSGRDTVVTTVATVDFDKITAGRQDMSPFMVLFSGTHEVEVVATAVGIGGTGRVHIKSVKLDGITVPRAALNFFVDRYVKPKHPELGLDSTFGLPARIDSAVVGNRVLTVRQK